MDVGREATDSELVDAKADCCWLPTTPAKLDLIKDQAICTNLRENDPIDQANQAAESNSYGSARLVEDFLLEAQTHRLSSCFGSQNQNVVSGSDFNNWQGGEASDFPGDNLRSFGTWQGHEAENSSVNEEDLNVYEKLSMHDADKWTNMSFGELLALAHGSGYTAVGNVDVQSDSVAADRISPSCFLEADGSFIPLKPFIDLSKPVTVEVTDASSSKNIPSQFEPVTPEKTNKKVSKLDEVPAANDIQENNISFGKAKEGLQENNEKSQLVETESTQLQENHKPDNGSIDDADLSKTPQQKPRRRKHRPKVIKEGEKKSTPKPRTRKAIGPEEKTSAKRKYTRREKAENLTNTPNSEDTPVGKKKKYVRRKVDKNEDNMDKGTPEKADIKTTGAAGRSCRRSLNFDLENQVRDESSSYSPSSNCDVESHENLNAKEESVDQSASIKGKCQIVLSDASHDKEASTADMMVNTDNQWMPKGQNGSMCSSSTCLSSGGEGRCFKRQHIGSTTEAELYNINAFGTLYNSLQAYGSMFSQNSDRNNSSLGIHFPTIYRKRGAWNGHYMEISENQVKLLGRNSTSRNIQGYSVAECEGTNLLRNNHVARGIHIHNEQEKSASLLALEPAEGNKKKRSRGPTRVRNVASPSRRTAKSSKRNQGVEIQHATKFTGPPLAITWKCMSTIESITEQLSQLKITIKTSNVRAQRQNTFMSSQEPGALVPYQRGGAVVPFDQVRRRKKPRPKVDLDDETTKVWRLLLENINNEGIDGTDEDKAKWWEEERRVFNGRADSFIARMHLVQGDRKFSPWKGSVIDSVVGVFLTQNVSDHLSSSAFMSLVARFPLRSEPKSETNFADLHEEMVSNKIEIEEPEACVLDPECGLGKELTNKLLCSEDAETIHLFEDDEIRIVDGAESSAQNKSTSLMENGRDIDDAFSSQTSVISSQNTAADSPNAESAESFSSSTLDKKPNAGVDPTGLANSTSFVKLLQMAGNLRHGAYENDTNKVFYENEQVQSGNSSLYPDGQKSSPNAHSSNNGQVEKSGNNYQENCKMHEASSIPNRAQDCADVTGSSSNIDNPPKSELKGVKSNNADLGKTVNGTKASVERIRKEKAKEKSVDWDELRKQAQAGGRKREKTANTMDSADWEAVRRADVNEIAQTIRDRGMNNRLAERIQEFLNRLVTDHGSIDLEWLRDVPPDKAKEYLLSVRGLGLKSVECVRLLTLHHLAFPVDTNVGRIAVRLGWVPLQPLPESLQLHLLEMYPILESIQQYLWPRLCKLDQKTLYELHYQMITFGKVFCTKSKPNCNACPMRGECRHFASAFASARLALPAPPEKGIVSLTENKAADQNPMRSMNTLQLPSPQDNNQAGAKSGASNSQPIIEEPASPEPTQVQECDIEDSLFEDPDEIPTIHLNMEEFTHNLQKIMQQNTELQEGDMSKALVALTRETASLPVPKLKNVSHLRTEHQVYELPDSHPLIQGMDKREPDDPSPYLLAIWTPGETMNSIAPPQRTCTFQESEKLCTDDKCSSCNSLREASSHTVRGTILIPCRTAMRGSFPLNGTYFQVNEVFSDHESSLAPIDVPRDWLWNLPRRTVYFGTSIPTIFKGLTTEGIQYCFWRGFVCVRGFDRKTRAPRPLIARLHFPASKLAKGKGKTEEN